MATKEKIWNIIVDEVPYKIEFSKNKVTVNDDTAVPVRKLNKESHAFDTKYFIPVGDKTAELHIKPMSDPVLSYEGKNCETGEIYAPIPFPKWGWIFVVLHGINFFLFVGGAIGGALYAVWLTLNAGIAMNEKKTGRTRVLQCIGIWLVATIIEFIIALFIASTTA